VGDTKLEIRTRIRGALAAAPPARLAASSVAICARVMESARVRDAASVMAFLPLPTEPDIRPLMGELLAGGRRLCLPRVDWARQVMEPAAVTGLDALLATRHGLMEPPAGAAVVAVDQIGAVLVPGLAFDAGGRRLGRGGGFYDRFLGSLAAPRPFVCGVAFDLQIVDALPADSWDQRVDAIATETRWLTPE
jgi:5-formyltetrahydrofolate cyclo-ligase